MSFGVSVYKPSDVAKRDPTFDAPLATDGVFFEFWHSPAVELGLPLLSTVYHEGLEISASELAPLRQELAALQQHWLTVPAVPDFREGLSLREFLAQRAGSLATAIDRAESCGGKLIIS